LGMGYRFSEMNKRISSANDSNIVTRLASRSVTGHDLPIQVHPHYGLEVYLTLHPNNTDGDSIETCIRRGFSNYRKAQKACLQLEKSALQGLCSCIYDERRVLSMSDKVEPCLIAKPVLSFDTVCNCDLCNPRTEEELASLRWEQKAYQDCMEKQRDIFYCRQIEDHYELIG